MTTRRSGWFFCLLRRIQLAGAERERRLHPEKQQQDTFADQMNVASSGKRGLIEQAILLFQFCDCRPNAVVFRRIDIDFHQLLEIRQGRAVAKQLVIHRGAIA